jgi:PAS domain S-box-containing protein
MSREERKVKGYFLNQGTPVLNQERASGYPHASMEEDLTEEETHTARNADRFYRLLLEATDEGIFGLDCGNRLIFINPAAAQMFGYRAEEMFGKNIHALLHHSRPDGSRYPEEECSLLRVLQTGESARGEEVFWRKDGTALHVQYFSQPLRLGDEFAGAILTCNDITARKRQEAEIKDQNARLRRAIIESNHRIKNSLQTLTTLLETEMAAHSQEALSGEIQTLLPHIRALSALHDLLTETASRTDSVEFICIKDLLDRLIQLFRKTVGERTIHADVPPVAVPSRQAASLALMVNELLSNAIKHAQGEVALSLKTEENRGTLEVWDDGPGFPPDFDPDTAANTGLKLVESLARWDLHGGVSYANRPEGGARVRMQFTVKEWQPCK